MNNKKSAIILSITIIVLVITVVSSTYAFFRVQEGETVTKDVTVTTHTVDELLFDVSNDIRIESDQFNFGRGGGNVSDEATTTAILRPNSKTGSSNKNYYIYLYIPTNELVYSEANTNQLPELLLQVFDENDQLVTISELGSQKTVGSLTGYDITKKTGLYTILNNHEISASNYEDTTEEYRVVVTYINHDFKQNDNTGKEVIANIILSETTTTYCTLNPTDVGCNFTPSYNPPNHTITLANGYIYHHIETLENGAEDESFRYAGANPNNYVCFGSDLETCPPENIYRIIGLIPVDVVTDETDPDNPVTERQMLYKLIKNDYETSTSLGMVSPGIASKAGSSSIPSGNQPTGDVDGFYWDGSLNATTHYNTWSLSTLNTEGLNTNVYGTFDSIWQEKIANVIWKVGGNTSANIYSITPMSVVYTNEILNPVSTNTQDGKTEYIAKIGMIYASDYGYAAMQSAWTIGLSSYDNNTISAKNWLYKGVREWILTRISSSTTLVYDILGSGRLGTHSLASFKCGIRSVFYLDKSTVIDMNGAHAGTLDDPYRIS